MSAYNAFNNARLGGRNNFLLPQGSSVGFGPGFSGGVTQINQGAGILCTPNPITGVGTIAATGGTGVINTASNVGAGAGVFKQVVADDLEFRSIVGSGGITSVQNTDDVDLSLTEVAQSIIINSGVNGTGLSPELSAVDGSTTFDISAGTLQIFDYSNPLIPVVAPVSFPETLNIPCTLLGNPAERIIYISINAAGAVLQDIVPPDAEMSLTQVLIGNLSLRDDVGTNDVIAQETVTPITAYGTTDAIRQYVISKKGINISGNEYSGRGDFNLDRTRGIGLRFGAGYSTDKNNPDLPVAPAETPCGFIRHNYTNASGDLVTISTGSIDVTQYNLNGVLTTVNPVTRFQIIKIFFFYSGGLGSTFTYAGTALYSTAQEAIDAINTESWEENDATFDAAPRGFLIIAGNAAATNGGTFVVSGNERAAIGSGSTGGAGTTTLQQAYENGPTIVSTVAEGTLLIQDNATPVGTILQVNDNAAASTLAVNPNNVVVKSLQTGGTGANSLDVIPFGASAGNTGEIRMRELTASGTDYCAIKSPDAIASSYTLTLPIDDGAANEVLTTDGSGILSWTAKGGGGGGATYMHVESTGSVAISGNLETSPLANNSSVTTNTSDLTYTAATGVVNIITDGIYTFNGMCSMLQNLVPPGAAGTTFCLFWRSGVTASSGIGGRGMGFNEQVWDDSAQGNGEKHYNLNWTGFLAAADTMRFGIRHDDTVVQSTLSNQNLASSDPRLTEFWVTKH